MVDCDYHKSNDSSTDSGTLLYSTVFELISIENLLQNLDVHFSFYVIGDKEFIIALQPTNDTLNANSYIFSELLSQSEKKIFNIYLFLAFTIDKIEIKHGLNEEAFSLIRRELLLHDRLPTKFEIIISNGIFFSV